MDRVESATTILRSLLERGLSLDDALTAMRDKGHGLAAVAKAIVNNGKRTSQDVLVYLDERADAKQFVFADEFETSA